MAPVRVLRVHLGCWCCGADAIVPVDQALTVAEDLVGVVAVASWWMSHYGPELLATEVDAAGDVQVWRRRARHG